MKQTAILFLVIFRLTSISADDGQPAAIVDLSGMSLFSEEINIEEVISEIEILNEELTDLEARKSKLSKMGLILGFSTVIGMGSSAYCAWQAIDNYNSFNTVSYPELALEYKGRARDYSTAGIFSSAISMVLGSIEFLVLLDRRRIKKEIIRINRLIDERILLIEELEAR